MIRCIVIDKDGEALAELTSQIEKIPFLTVEGTFRNPLEANSILARRGADLVFIDPDTAPINGIDFVRSMIHNPMVVFVTKSHDFAVEAYNAGVLDYIVKPVSLDRIIRVASKAYELVLPAESATSDTLPGVIGTPYLFMKVDNRMQRFRTDEILFIEGCSDYVRIYTTGSRPAVASVNMKNIEKRLPHTMFCRVHRSYIVSLSMIDSIERKRIKIGDRIIPVSNSYYPLLLKAIDASVSA